MLNNIAVVCIPLDGLLVEDKRQQQQQHHQQHTKKRYLIPVRSSPEFLFKGTSMNFDQWFYNVLMVIFLFSVFFSAHSLGI